MISFWGGGLKPWKNKAEKIAGKIRCQYSPSNSPKIRRARLKISPQIRSAEPRDQHFLPPESRQFSPPFGLDVLTEFQGESGENKKHPVGGPPRPPEITEFCPLSWSNVAFPSKPFFFLLVFCRGFPTRSKFRFTLNGHHLLFSFTCCFRNFSEVRKRVVFERVVLADVPLPLKQV